MGATAVQANGGQKYERTTDPRRMLTHKLLTEVIRTDWENVSGFLPARTATSIRYDKGATKAVAWDEGGKETKIDLPFEDGWYVSDGNPFAIPNGRESNKADPDALFLMRHRDKRFSGPLGRGVIWSTSGGVSSGPTSAGPLIRGWRWLAAKRPRRWSG